MNRYTIPNLKSFLAPLYKGRQVGILPYAYPMTFLALTQAAVQTQQLQIAANADFCMLGLKYHAQIGAIQNVSTKTVAYVRALITDNGSGEQITSAAVDLENLANNGPHGVGSGAFPYPRLLAGRTSLTVQLTGYQPTAETYTTIDLLFEGLQVRVFK